MKILDKFLGKKIPPKVAEKLQNVQAKSLAANAESENKSIIENSLLFDAAWYCETYGFGKYLDAAAHYLNIGWRENKNPSPFFSTAAYLKKYPDVADAKINPLLHCPIRPQNHRHLYAMPYRLRIS